MSNVGYTPGAGKTIATDLISGVDYQRVKIVLGSTGIKQDLQPATPSASAASTAAATIASSSCTLFGISAFSTATGQSIIQVRDSTSSSTGVILWGAVLESTGTVTAAYVDRASASWFGPQGLKCVSGLRIVRAGAAKSTVTLYYLPHP